MKALFLIVGFIITPFFLIAQCNVSILNTNNDTLFVACGSTVELLRDTLGQYALNNDFNNGTIGPGWQSTSGATFTNPCGAKSSTYFWFGNTPTASRHLTTVPFDLSCGGQICFELKFAIQSQNAPCEGPDQANEGVALEFSVAGGPWTQIFYFTPNANGSFNAAYPGAGDYTAWATYCYPIPAAAMMPNTQIRWIQPGTSGAGTGFDHWGVDSVSISTNCGSVQNTWANGDTSVSQIVGPILGDSTYSVTRVTGAGSASPDTCYDTLIVSPHVPIVSIDPAFNPFCRNSDAEMFINPANSQYVDTNFTYLHQWGPMSLFDSTAQNYALIENLSFDTTIYYELMHPVFPQCIGYDTVGIAIGGVQFDSVWTTIPDCFRDTSSSAVYFSWSDALSPAISTLFRNGVWTTATIADSFVSLPADTFSIVVRDSRCSDTVGFRFELPDTVKIDTSMLILDLCQLQEKAQVVNGENGTAPYTAFWDSVPYMSPLMLKAHNDTVLEVYVEDATGCPSNSYLIPFSVPDPLLISQINVGICPESELELYASTVGGLGPDYYEYKWSTGANDSTITVFPEPGNNYSVTVEDNCVFPVQMSPSIVIYDLPDVGITATPEICVGDSIILEAPTQMLSYEIFVDGFDTLTEDYNVIYPTISGDYDAAIRIITFNGCEKLDTTSFTVYDFPEASFYFDTLVEYQVASNGTVDFINTSKYQTTNTWYYRDQSVGVDQDLSYEFIEAGFHDIQLEISNDLGCSDTAYGTVEVSPDLSLYIPNSFTPNGDNLNDLWEIYLPNHVEEFDLWIVDRWGNIVWESHDPENNVWDGTYKGTNELVTPGNYVYRLYVASPERIAKFRKEIHGSIMVLP